MGPSPPRSVPPAANGSRRVPRVAVVGVGAFGRHHARIYGELAEEGAARLVGLVDTDLGRAREHAARWGVAAVERVEELPEPPDAVTVAVPTTAHRAVAEPLLRRGIHCLVEKPIASSLADAEALVEAAREGGAMLQVGHVERFNPVMAAVERLRVRPPVFLEVHRLAPFAFRSDDVGVVLDLMIHDLDIVLHLVGEAPSRVDAVGVPVIGPREDIANARLEFPSGSVANVTASRVSMQRMRKIRVFSPDAYVSLDYDRRQALLVRKSPEAVAFPPFAPASTPPSTAEARAAADFGSLFRSEMLPIDEAEPLKEELRSFLDAVRRGVRPRVPGEEGARALALAERILRAIAGHPVPVA